MPAGADMGFSFDPPGAIGLVAPDARVLFRFHQPDATGFEILRPRDERGAVGDLTNEESEDGVPAVVPAACGNGRLFDPSVGSALWSTDVVAGGSLVTRGLTIMAIVSWDIAAQNAAGHAGTLVSRGTGEPAVVAERAAYGLVLGVVSAPARTGSIALQWQDSAGALHTQTATNFTVPTGFMLLTATRRWVSPTSVVCHYYIGDTMLAEIWSSDGDIAGAASGTFIVGCDRLGGAGELRNGMAGTLDELAVFDREMCIEEIADTWQRITVWQPLGVQLYREMHDPGFPLSDDPASDIQLETRQIGMAFGFAASIIENIRRNILPQRAYGQVLELWEEVLRPTRLPTPVPDSGIDARRARVLARMRQRGGCSIPALKRLLEVLLGGADPDFLQFLSFTNTVQDNFGTLNLLRWDVTPVGSTTSVFGKALMRAGTGTFTVPNTWITMRRSAGGDCKQANHIVKVIPDTTTTVLNTEAGNFFSNAAAGNYLLLGVRDTGGTWAIFTESFVGGVSAGAVNRATLGAAPTQLWLWLAQSAVDGIWTAQWSTTSGTEGFTAPVTITHPTTAHWSGNYIRSIGAIAGGTKYNFDVDVLRTPFGFAPLNAYVYLDPAFGFTADLPGVRQCIAAVKHAFIHGTFITSPVLVCDDRDNGCDQAPLGGY